MNEQKLREILGKIPLSVWRLYLTEQDQQTFDSWWLAASDPQQPTADGNAIVYGVRAGKRES